MASSIIVRIIGITLLASAGYILCSEPTPYAIYWSPTRLYKLEVYSDGQLFAFPGSSGDASGIVMLKNQNNRVLNKTKVEMIQLIQDAEWTENKVSVRLVFDWALPSPTTNGLSNSIGDAD